MHYFAIDDLANAYDADSIRQWSDDGISEAAILAVQEWARDKAEEFVKSRIAVLYDPDQWDVDADSDGICDDVPGILVDCSVAIALYKLASRRSDIPQSIIDNYNEAKMILEAIAAGQRPLDADSSVATQRTIAGNMTEADLGALTEDGEALPWSGYM